MSSIFFEFHLPNSTTWFYFSLFLAVALFFQFSRVFSVRNWDLLGLFLFAPGFLWILEGNQARAGSPPDGTLSTAHLLGYGWLLAASLLWFVRCWLDFAMTRRPLMSPNLTTAGLAWFGGSLFLCFVAVAFTRPDDPWGDVGKRAAVVDRAQEQATAMVSQGEAAAPGRGPRVWVERSFAILCHLAVVAGLVCIGARQFQDTATGVTAGTLYLLIPYTAFHTGQVHHVWPAAVIVWAVYFFRHPFAAGALLGFAAGTIFFPAVLFPAWAHFYWRRGFGRFALGFAAAGLLSLAVTVAVLRAAGEFSGGFADTLKLADWLPWYEVRTESLWRGVHWAYRLPVFLVYLGFAVTILFWPAVRNLGHLIAVSAALLIGIQFWYADRGGLYVLWYSPLLVLMILRPNLTDLTPAAAKPLPGFVTAATRWVGGWVWKPRHEDAKTIAA